MRTAGRGDGGRSEIAVAGTIGYSDQALIPEANQLQTVYVGSRVVDGGEGGVLSYYYS